MKKTILIVVALLTALMPVEAKKVKKAVQTDREYWCQEAYRMAQPVLENMARGELQKNMKTEFSPSFDNRNRKVVYMETFGRLMARPGPASEVMTTTRNVHRTLISWVAPIATCALPSPSASKACMSGNCS